MVLESYEWKMLVCIIGIYSTYIWYGLCQEHLYVSSKKFSLPLSSLSTVNVELAVYPILTYLCKPQILQL